MLFKTTFINNYVYVCVCVFYISNPTNAIHIVPFFLSQVAKVELILQGSRFQKNWQP